MNIRHTPRLLALLLGLSCAQLHAEVPGPSLDSLNAAALSLHPDSMVSEGRLLWGNNGPLLYKVELRNPQGLRREMVLDATSSTMLWEEERQLHSAATLPLGWQPGDGLPSFDRLVTLARVRYPQAEIEVVSLRRIGDGRLLCRLHLKDASGKRRELVIDNDSAEIITDREE